MTHLCCCRPRHRYNRTRCRRICQSSREPWERRRTSVIRDRHADSGPWAAPNRNGPGMSCWSRELQDNAGRREVPGHSRWRRWAIGSHSKCRPQHIRERTGRIECHPVTNRGTNRTLRITGPFGGLLTSVREDDSAGRGGPVDICNSSGNTCG